MSETDFLQKLVKSKGINFDENPALFIPWRMLMDTKFSEAGIANAMKPSTRPPRPCRGTIRSMAYDARVDAHNAYQALVAMNAVPPNTPVPPAPGNSPPSRDVQAHNKYQEVFNKANAFYDQGLTIVKDHGDCYVWALH